MSKVGFCELPKNLHSRIVVSVRRFFWSIEHSKNFLESVLCDVCPPAVSLSSHSAERALAFTSKVRIRAILTLRAWPQILPSVVEAIVVLVVNVWPARVSEDKAMQINARPTDVGSRIVVAFHTYRMPFERENAFCVSRVNQRCFTSGQGDENKCRLPGFTRMPFDLINLRMGNSVLGGARLRTVEAPSLPYHIRENRKDGATTTANAFNFDRLLGHWICPPKTGRGRCRAEDAVQALLGFLLPKLYIKSPMFMPFSALLANLGVTP
jgi:hypothetical protein